MTDTEIQFISIASRWDSTRILYRGQHATLREALVAAVASGADLRGANLRGADLSGANLRDANLCGADLRDANLSDADLCDADLSGADLCDANLHGAHLCDANLCDANLHGAHLCDANLCDANLHGADLRGANLRDANLHGANLCGANLHGANLSDANLRDANLRNVPDLAAAKADLWSIFDLTPREVLAVRNALIEGKVSGSTYQGSCACLVGTIANARDCHYTNIPGIVPNADRPAEQFFIRIRPGHVPAVNYHAALAVLWIDEWTAAHPEHVSPHVDAEGVCVECEKMLDGTDGRAGWCAYHRTHPTRTT